MTEIGAYVYTDQNGAIIRIESGIHVAKNEIVMDHEPLVY